MQMIAPAPTLTGVESCLNRLRGDILSLGVRRLALFGSVARNEARHDSDIDLLVEFEPGQKTFDRFMALADLLEEAGRFPAGANRLGHRPGEETGPSTLY